VKTAYVAASARADQEDTLLSGVANPPAGGQSSDLVFNRLQRILFGNTQPSAEKARTQANLTTLYSGNVTGFLQNSDLEDQLVLNGMSPW
jgi:hypothetical protein